MGRAAAANLVRRLKGEPTRPFRYIDYGNLATVGRKAAIVDLAVPGLGALRFSGFSAWLFWLFAHIYFLIGFRNRLIVMVDWAWAYFTYERSARVVAEPASYPPRRRPPKLRAPARRSTAMDTRTSPARLRIERIQRGAARRPAAPPSLIPSSDPHLSEYLPERWQAPAVGIGLHRLGRRRWPSRSSSAALFADSRYWVQAERELAGSGIELVRIADAAGASYHIDWLCANVARGATVAVDGDVLGLGRRAPAARPTLGACGIALRSDLDVLAGAWPERPTTPTAAVYEHRAPRGARSRAANRLAPGARRDARGRRDASLRLDRRRHRLDAQPARRRRQLQPGVPRPPADRRRHGDALRRRRPRSTPRWPPRSPPTAFASRPTSEAGAALAALPESATPAASIRSADDARHCVERSRATRGRGDQPEHARQEQEERGRGGARAPGDGRGRRGDVRVLRLVRGGARRPGAARRRSPS